MQGARTGTLQLLHRVMAAVEADVFQCFADSRMRSFHISNTVAPHTLLHHVLPTINHQSDASEVKADRLKMEHIISSQPTPEPMS